MSKIKMGNAMCCGSPDDGQDGTVESGRRLFGKMHNDAESESSDDKNDPLDERLRDLVPKIRQVKQLLDICVK